MANKISVAIATYNGSRFLREQLDSIYSQTLVPDEVVVCDDCSKDCTVEILEEYHQKYGLKYFVNECSLGVNNNFMRAFSLCNGDFICICDQDDIWYKEKISVLFEEMLKQDQSKPAIIASSITDVDSNGTPISSPIVKPYSSSWKSTIISTNNSQGCTMMMNRSLLDLAIKIYEREEMARLVMYDVLLSIVAAACGTKINTGRPLMYYRHHDNNVVGKIGTKRTKKFGERVREMPTYYPFLMDYRLKELSLANSFLKCNDINVEVSNFLTKIDVLIQCNNHFSGLLLVLSMEELSILRRLKILVFTPIVILLKKIYG